MTDKPRTERENRLSAALRDNLKRRKAQARGRAADEGSPKSDNTRRLDNPEPQGGAA
jgi:hypothetical protein